MGILEQLAAEEEVAKAAPPNLRTCGTWSGNRTRPQRSTRASTGAGAGGNEQTKSVPSIPSRFEVVLHQGDREHLGFGSHSLRFEGSRSEEVPGPGRYSDQKAFHQDFGDRSGWGIRGTGGFASRSKRFGARSMPMLPRPGLGCPGPGAYNAESATTALRSHQDFSKAKGTSVFAARTQKGESTAQPVPGPGHYPNSGFKPDAPASASAVSAFRSASQRTGGVPPSTGDGPAPGQYHSDAPWVPPSPVGQGGAELGTAVFKEPSRRRVCRVHRDLPAADDRARERLGNFASEVARECAGSSRNMAALPGPGHYEQDRDEMWEGALVGANGSSSFQPGQRSNFAGQEGGLLPGPGKYDPQKVVPHKLTSAVSAFSSGTERNRLLLRHAPGPAYYSPLPQRDARSFMMNAKRNWVA